MNKTLSEQAKLLARMADFEKQKQMLQLIEPASLIEGSEMAKLAKLAKLVKLAQ
jgi:hypothetical protein